MIPDDTINYQHHDFCRFYSNVVYRTDREPTKIIVLVVEGKLPRLMTEGTDLATRFLCLEVVSW